MTKRPRPQSLSVPIAHLYGTLVQLMLCPNLGGRGGGGGKARSKSRHLRLIECHGPLYGVEEDVVLKRLSEKRYRAISHRRASDGFLVVRRNDNDARLWRNEAQLLLKFETAHAGDPDID